MAIFKYILLLALSIGQISCRETPEEIQDQIKLSLEITNDEPLKPDNLKPFEESDKHDNDYKEHVLQGNEKGLFNRTDIYEDEHVIQGNEEGLLDKQSCNDDDENVINLNLNIDLKKDKKEGRETPLSQDNDFSEPIDWKTLSTLARFFISYGKEFRGFNTGESLGETLEETKESHKRSRNGPHNQNIKRKLDIIYKVILNLVKKDKKLNNEPVVFYNTLFPFVKDFLRDSSNINIDEEIKIADGLLRFPFIRDFMEGFLGFLGLEDFSISKIQNELDLMKIFGLYTNEENKVLAEGYKEALNTFIKIVREDVEQNNLPAGTFEFIWEKTIELSVLIEDLFIIPPRVSSKVKRDANINSKSKPKIRSHINSNIQNFLEHFDMNSKSKRDSDINSNIQFFFEYLDHWLKQTTKGNNRSKRSNIDTASPTENKYLRKFGKAKSSSKNTEDGNFIENYIQMLNKKIGEEDTGSYKLRRWFKALLDE